MEQYIQLETAPSSISIHRPLIPICCNIAGAPGTPGPLEYILNVQLRTGQCRPWGQTDGYMYHLALVFLLARRTT